MPNTCIFCNPISSEVVLDDVLVYARKDKHPVTSMHTLIIPKRHVESYFLLDHSEINAVHKILRVMKEKIEMKDESVSAFNIGINSGADAGQSIAHLHIHLIPRRKGDVDNPQGGVRGVIPRKQHY
ncbi:MAG: HIT family protein [Acidiferrobacteraceae bacterium]|nr:HIT family protein [Acidiferrobacteraceae bacterium]|tara:strand:- start:542 stop:919 length:378 start_codon:yes stop_codon:yes gene_type:complete